MSRSLAKKTTRLAVVALALVVVGGASGCGDDEDEVTTGAAENTGTSTVEGAPAAGKPEPSAKVAIADFEYDPDPVTVEAGGTVTWANDDTASHTASSDEEAVAEFDTGTLDRGDSKKVTLDEPGTYAYHCDFHATMNGTVEVVE